MTYMTSFPMHQAADALAVHMIEQLFRYNASASLRTSGKEIIKGLLPVHVVIEHTCLHKYLEDNLLTEKKFSHDNVDLIYKLIYLLCGPQMVVILDMARMFSNYTDNVVDELWNYIKDGEIGTGNRGWY